MEEVDVSTASSALTGQGGGVGGDSESSSSSEDDESWRRISGVNLVGVGGGVGGGGGGGGRGGELFGSSSGMLCYSDPDIGGDENSNDSDRSSELSGNNKTLTDETGYMMTPPLSPSHHYFSKSSRLQRDLEEVEEEEEEDECDSEEYGGSGLGSQLYTNPDSKQIGMRESLDWDNEEGEEGDEWGSGKSKRSSEDLLTREFRGKKKKEEKGERKKIGSTLSFSYHFPNAAVGTPREEGEVFGFVDWNVRFQKCVEKLSDTSSFDISEQVNYFIQFYFVNPVFLLD